MQQTDKKVSVVEWFDVHNMEHKISYLYLIDNGTWPKHFVPADVEMVQGWNGLIAAKMARAWCKKILTTTRKEVGL